MQLVSKTDRLNRDEGDGSVRAVVASDSLMCTSRRGKVNGIVVTKGEVESVQGHDKRDGGERVG